MPDLLAIVSKAVFEKEAPQAKLGAVLPMRKYKSVSKYLERLSESGSRLFLVTVRPPDERLWLVAVLADPQSDDDGWTAAKNRIPVTDISALVGKLRFESGKGIQAKKGALGMSLQTPRALTAADAALILESVPAAAPKPVQKQPPGPINVGRHDPDGPLPCLCFRCLPSAPETIEHDNAAFLRAQIEAQGRVLWFWVPREIEDEMGEIARAVTSRLRGRLKPLKHKGGAGAAPAPASSEDDDGDED